ncbi:methylmalonyl Co-A mutase-associated GTPase MeaB [Stappia sp. F7233]|uniref:Methylmalonyl Co-A mutase-associated GTPase MeaB n=1 Tax=Stappia albiluteola TaxID=2758565 RepID=A0A839AFH7_9HYPH|nr:methylmalonyl Co-A mutase-associated GTPase MeaB [Stappia albiluteola]MBA5777642.1 methylmalonyl Co-A mutase-associated GTPase MeaB [Stappia albiluteola]
MKARPKTLEELRAGGKPALARMLSALETEEGGEELAAFLDASAKAANAHVIGLTGPPGVGKSTLTNALISSFRRQDLTVGVIAVDPSSQFTGGALLGDRTRLRTDPEDDGVFVRSMAARDRLGGLSDHAVAAVVVMSAVMDRVIVESVGIGQSEADVAFVADTVVLCIQPGSGDSLQFMKAGVMELPDVVAVTKSDMGALANRARADVEGALSLARLDDRLAVPEIVMVSATAGTGIDEVVDACNSHFRGLREAGILASRRETQHRRWVRDAIRQRFGSHGLAKSDIDAALDEAGGPFRAIRGLDGRLRS